MSSIFKYMSYSEFFRLVACASLDVTEFIIVLILTPLVGDLFSFVSLATSIVMFGWIGLITLLDFVPGLDLLPINVITWLIWMRSKRQQGARRAVLRRPY